MELPSFEGLVDLETGGVSENKTILYLLGPTQGTHPAEAHVFYAVHYYDGYHLSVAAGEWQVISEDTVNLLGVQAVIFTDVVEDPSSGGAAGSHGLNTSPYRQRWTVTERAGIALDEANAWGGAHIPEPWAVSSWNDALDHALYLLGECIRAGTLPEGAFATTPAPDPEGKMATSPKRRRRRHVSHVKADHGLCNQELESSTKWALITGSLIGFLVGGCIALIIASNVGSRRAGAVFIWVFLLIPAACYGLYALWRRLSRPASLIEAEVRDLERIGFSERDARRIARHQ